MNKKIYFAGSIRGGRVDAALYQRIIQYINRTDVVLTEHIGKSNLSIKVRTREIDKQIYEQDTEWLRTCDILIAECTCPSLGVGYELGYAEAHNIPVYIFYNKNIANISAMLNGNSYFTVIPYETEECINGWTGFWVESNIKTKKVRRDRCLVLAHFFSLLILSIEWFS